MQTENVLGSIIRELHHFQGRAMTQAAVVRLEVRLRLSTDKTTTKKPNL